MNDEEKINILNYVYDWLVGKDFVPKGKESLVRYFIKEDLESTLGGTEFTQDDIEIINLNNGIVIYSIFGEPLKINVFDTQIGATVDGLRGNEKVFTMSNTAAGFMNQVNGEEVSKLYRVNGSTFSLSTGYDKEVKSVDDYDVILSLTPYNAKFRDTEVFELNRIKPAQELPKSTLQRIKALVDCDSIVRIRTSMDLVDNIDVCDKIFDELKTRTNKIRLANLKMLEK